MRILTQLDPIKSSPRPIFFISLLSHWVPIGDPSFSLSLSFRLHHELHPGVGAKSFPVLLVDLGPRLSSTPVINHFASQPAIAIVTQGRDHTGPWGRGMWIYAPMVAAVVFMRLRRLVAVFPIAPSSPPQPRSSAVAPPLGFDRHGSINPALVSNSLQHPKSDTMPRHRLGVSSPTLDTTAGTPAHPRYLTASPSRPALTTSDV
jgi:hypothetical protein